MTTFETIHTGGRPFTLNVAVPDRDSVQCIACGLYAAPSVMDESSDEDGPFWTCMNRAACMRRVRAALKAADVYGELDELRRRVDALERDVRSLRAGIHTKFN